MSKDEGKRIKSSTAINKEGLASWKKDYVKNNNKSSRQNKQQRRKKKKLLTVRAICRGGLSQVGQILGRFDRASRSEAYLSLPS